MAFDHTNYHELDYIETDGSAYINTGYRPTNNTYIVAHLYFVGSGNLWGVNSSGSTIGHYSLFNSGGKYRFRCYISTNYDVPATGSDDYIFTKDFYVSVNPRSEISVTDGTTTYSRSVNIGTSGTCARPLYLLANNSQGSVASCVAGNRIYAMNIYDSYQGTLLYDFVPAKRISDGVVGLFDTVNETFYAPPTGAFTYGKIIGADTNLKIKVNGTWKDATPYIKVNGIWKEATPFIKVNGAWKEAVS